jgi:putative cell wall-binding protein
MADRGAGRVVGGRVGRTLAVAFALVATLFVGSVGAPGSVSAETDTNPEFTLIPADLEFMLKQIQIAEAHAAGGDLLCALPTDTSGKCVPDPMLPLGLRTVDGSYNNLEFNEEWGASHHPFPRRLQPVFREGSVAPFGAPPNPPGATAMCADPGSTCYSQNTGFVYDPEPRVISNLIVDQTTANPAAVAAAEAREGSVIGPSTPSDPGDIFLPNTTADEELSAPFNAWFTFFGQFFDHGLDLVSKGGSGTVVIPLQEDDPLWDITPPNQRFMMVSRATNQPGPDGILGNGDDVHEHDNLTSPFVDQNQTYTSHPAHQVFLREYELVGGVPRATGHLLDGADGGLATWNDIKIQAREVLGIALGLAPGATPGPAGSDYPDVLQVPQVMVDEYGNFVPGANGFPQLVTTTGLVQGNLGSPVSTANALRTGNAFLDDIAHGATLTTSDLSGYDNVLLGEHFITGDGRGNENIALTAVHHVFHSEHNRMVEEIKEILNGTAHPDHPELGHPNIAELRNAFMGLDHTWEPLMGDELPQPEEDDWSYEERLFQAAKFATEMQYQHLVFEEFARRVQPEIDAVVLNENSYDTTIDPSIVAEFAHVVYRFGHSMLTEDVQRDLDLNGDGVRDGSEVTDASLLDAFLNPVSYLCPVPPVTVGGLSSCPTAEMTPDQAAGAIVNGTTNQVGNQIDEFVIDTLRNNLLGLPLDLPAINMARARDAGVPGLQEARRTFFAATGDARLRPYTSWADFDLNLRNGNNFGRGPNNQTLVNFIAAYGTHDSVTSETSNARKRAAADIIVNSPLEFTSRIAGTSRYITAAQISAEHFSPGVPVVYITSGVNFPDAIAGGSAAAYEGGPILLTEQNAIPAATQLELQRLEPARIVVLGGPVAVSDLVVDALQQFTPGSVARMFGPDRYQTAAQISSTVFAANAPVVYVASGTNFPDALAGSAVAARDRAPMLLVRPTNIPGATSNELNRLNPSRIVVLGGPGVVSAAVEAQLASFLAPGGTIERLAGANRYATAARISEASFPARGPAVVYVATGEDFPDALSAGPVAGVLASAAVTGPHAAPLLLVPQAGDLPAVVAAEIERLAPYRIVILGGPGAVPPEMQAQLEALAPTVPADRLEFMNSNGGWVGLDTGLEGIDFWVGGLAEALDPFGGMLGSTFNYVFEEQLEDLQFGDRFYYLFRNQGNQLFAGLENNSFASLIRRNTDATYIPADIFAIQDPYFEIANLPDPLPPGLLNVNGCIQWDGDEHIEIHGTPDPDCIIGGQGDDSLWGYASNDRIEGGSGNDIVIAGDGDDIVTDSFGDDNLKGGWGNDAINTGPGIDDLVTASHGDDFIVLVADTVKTVFAGTGDDVVLGGTGRDNVFSGEGDDWVEGGPHADLLMGDNANQFQNDPNGGHDVLIGGAGSDDHDSDGGDDIMVGNAGGTDRYEGMMGFDWVTYFGETAGIQADLRFLTIQRPDIQAIRDRYDLVEGMSGGAGNDIIRGMGHPLDDLSQAQAVRHLLTEEHLARIDGLTELLRPGGTHGDYSERFMTVNLERISNLIMGGPGSDVIEGRAGDDFLDGDAYLRVRLTDGVNVFDSAAQLEAAVFAGTTNPGSIDIVREIVVDPPVVPDPDAVPPVLPEIDTAVYEGDRSLYSVVNLGDGYLHVNQEQATEAGDIVGGNDIIRNFEVLQFGDQCLFVNLDPAVPVADWETCAVAGTVELTWDGSPGAAPIESQPDDPRPITATVTLDPAIVGPVTEVRFNWQAGEVGEAWDPSESGDNGLPDVPNGLVDTFHPGSADAGAILRVVVTFRDANGQFHSIASAATPEVVNVNDPPTVPTLTPTDPVVGGAVKVGPFDDEDGVETASEPGGITYQWQSAPSPDGPWTNIGGPTTDTGVIITPALVGQHIGVVITYTDDQGTGEEITSGTAANQITPTNPVAALP